MSAEHPSHMSLLQLAAELASQARMPPQLVLRRLCEWIVADAFPEGALIKATGTNVKPFDIYMSFRAIETDTMLTGIHLDGCTSYDNGTRWGAHLLSEILVQTQDVLAFCERTNTLPPRSLLGGFRRLWAEADGSKNLAPPACPDAEERAAKIQARDVAVGFINNLLSKLSGLQGNRTAFGPQRVSGEPIDFIYWKAQWDKVRAHAEAAIARYEALDLQQQLESLDAQWAAFVEQETKTATIDAGVSKNQKNSSSVSEKALGRPRRPGRPPGSGSFETSDALLIEEMRPIFEQNPHLSVTRVANQFADRAEGGGTPQSRTKRLTDRYLKAYPKALDRNQLE